MKKNKLSASFSFTASVAVAVACAAGCSKKNDSNPTLPAPPESPATHAAPATNAALNSHEAMGASLTTNLTPRAAEKLPTNPPPAATAASAARSRPPASATSGKKSGSQVVEMPMTVPAAPTNFYPADFSATMDCCAPTTANYYFRLRGGHEHVSHGDNNDTFYLSVKFYANGGAFREQAGNNAWLIPDADAEFSHQYLAKPDGGGPDGSGEGVQLRASFFWPWFNWTTRLMAGTNTSCPLNRPLALGFGPTVNIGFDKLFDHTDARLSRYFGVRATLNHDGFLEYTVGGTDGLGGTRHQVLAELPVFTSRDRAVRYVVRGLWNTGGNSTPDLFQAGMFVEVPFDFLAEPSRWSSLNPFKK